MQLTSPLAVTVSSTFRFARVWSMSSARTSSSLMAVPLMVSRMPSSRSRALSAAGRPAKAMQVPPFGSAFFRISPACLPASLLLDPR